MKDMKLIMESWRKEVFLKENLRDFPAYTKKVLYIRHKHNKNLKITIDSLSKINNLSVVPLKDVDKDSAGYILYYRDNTPLDELKRGLSKYGIYFEEKKYEEFAQRVV